MRCATPSVKDRYLARADGMDRREAIIADRSLGVELGMVHLDDGACAWAKAQRSICFRSPRQCGLDFRQHRRLHNCSMMSLPPSDVGPQVRTYAWPCRAAQGSCRTSGKTCHSDRVRGICRTSCISVRADPDLRVIEAIPRKDDKSCISSSVGTRGDWMSWTAGPISFGYLKLRKAFAARPARADRRRARRLHR